MPSSRKPERTAKARAREDGVISRPMVSASSIIAQAWGLRSVS